MGASFTADAYELEVLEERLLRAPEMMRELAANLGEECVNLVREGFEETTDPYGSGWAGTKRGNRPLHGPTGVLRNAWSGFSAGLSFGVASGVGYAGFHQGGTSRMVARKMVPDSGELPGKWFSRFDEVAQEFFDERFGW